MVNLLI